MGNAVKVDIYFTAVEFGWVWAIEGKVSTKNLCTNWMNNLPENWIPTESTWRRTGYSTGLGQASVKGLPGTPRTRDQDLKTEQIHYCNAPWAVWAFYQIRKIAGCACAGNAGNVSPRRRLQRKTLVSDPVMHHGTCVMHMPWCMSGSLTSCGGENVPGIPGACAPAILRIWQEAHGVSIFCVHIEQCLLFNLLFAVATSIQPLIKVSACGLKL